MAKKSLTARFVETVKVERRTDYWDSRTTGLVLRVTPGGVKSWVTSYNRKSDGKKLRVTMGRFPVMTLEKARNEALQILSRVAAGEDPAGEIKAIAKADTIAELAGRFIEEWSKPRKKTWLEDKRLLDAEVLPAIGGMNIHRVRRSDVRKIILAKANEGHLRQANAIRSVCVSMFNWAIEEELLEASPAAAIKPMGKTVQRERTLSDTEIAQLWLSLPGANTSWQMRMIIKLLLLTGQRSGEVCGITRGEIDTESRVWTIPSERVKNGRQHAVPLSDAALRLIEHAFDNCSLGLDAPLFSITGKPFESNAVSKAVRYHFQWFKEPWTPHDLRRTAASGMAGQGVLPHVIEAVLNHQSGFRSGVAGVYNRHEYQTEKRDALEQWAEYIATITRQNG